MLRWPAGGPGSPCAAKGPGAEPGEPPASGPKGDTWQHDPEDGYPPAMVPSPETALGMQTGKTGWPAEGLPAKDWRGHGCARPCWAGVIP